MGEAVNLAEPTLVTVSQASRKASLTVAPTVSG